MIVFIDLYLRVCIGFARKLFLLLIFDCYLLEGVKLNDLSQFICCNLHSRASLNVKSHDCCELRP